MEKMKTKLKAAIQKAEGIYFILFSFFLKKNYLIIKNRII
jgi:hypothetical protein